MAASTETAKNLFIFQNLRTAQAGLHSDYQLFPVASPSQHRNSMAIRASERVKNFRDVCLARFKTSDMSVKSH